MERTPKSKKLSLSHKYKGLESSAPEELTNSEHTKTPTQNKLSISCENDYSPIYVPCTQEAFDQLDVIWDWNSPQSKYKQKLPVQKRSHNCQSPKLPIKKSLSCNQIESYDKLKNELEALKNELVESRDFEKNINKALFNNKTDEKDDELKDLDDLFTDDSLEEEMILQSQKIEELLTMEIKNNACDMYSIPIASSNISSGPSKSDLRKVKSENHINNDLTIIKRNSISRIDVPQVFNIKHTEPVKSPELHTTDDFFDFALESFTNDQVVTEDSMTHKEILNKSIQDNEKLKISKICNHEEIEQKRLQALEKLKLKKQQVAPPKTTGVDVEYMARTNSDKERVYKDETSPIKCSPEEIEQKRLQAVAKLEAKKKQEQIERNKREALKRLEMNKKKRSMVAQNFYNKK